MNKVYKNKLIYFNRTAKKINHYIFCYFGKKTVIEGKLDKYNGFEKCTNVLPKNIRIIQKELKYQFQQYNSIRNYKIYRIGMVL